LPRNDICKLYRTTENIERAANGEIYPPIAELLDTIKICELVHTARVSHRTRTVRAEQCDQRFLNTLPQAFYINTMHEKFIAAVGKLL